jgi:undecaprenyl-diphosphatase
VAAAVLATVHRTRGRRAAVVPVAATLLASAVANGPLKHAVRRARPDRTVVPPQRRTGEREDTPSFPSSHAATAFAFASATTVLVPPLAIVTLPAAVAVSASRVVVGDHYPMDVVVGALLGVAVGGGASRATERRGWV